MWTVFNKEIHAFLDSLIAYVVVSVFLVSMSLVLFFFPDSSLLRYGYADLSPFFNLCPYVLLFLVPALTMRSYAEERRLGTLECLLTAPLAVGALVLAKFLASMALLGLCLLATLGYYICLYALGNPVGNIDSGQVAGSYVGLYLIGGVFCAMGQCCSSLTKNQLIAFLLATFLCFISYVGMAAFMWPEGVGGISSWWVQAFSLASHYDTLGKGLFSLKELIFFLVAQAFFLVITTRVLRVLRH